MTERELMQMALDVMLAAIKAGDWKVDGACDPDYVFEALRAALARPEREWQGLTDEEIDEILDDVIGFNSCFGPETDFARAVEAKLKEKNNGGN